MSKTKSCINTKIIVQEIQKRQFLKFFLKLWGLRLQNLIKHNFSNFAVKIVGQF